MPQTRYYLVTIEGGDHAGTRPRAVHSPADFLQHATMSEGERAKPGKVYSLGNGSTITYKPISKAEYERLSMGDMADDVPVTLENVTINTAVEKLVIALTPESRKGVVRFHGEKNGELPYEAEDTERDCAVYFATKLEAYDYLRDAWRIESITYEDNSAPEPISKEPITLTDAGGFLQGKTADDRKRLMQLEVCSWLNYDEYPDAARTITSKGITLLCDETVKLDQALKLTTEELPEGASGIIEGSRSYAAFKMPDTPRELSKRQKRRKAGEIFGIQR